MDMPVDELIQSLLTNIQTPAIPLTVSPGQRKSFKWLCGHCLSMRGEDDIGPKREYTGMIIGKQQLPGDKQLAGLVGQQVRDALSKSDLRFPEEIYLTTLLKTPALIPGKFQMAWVKQQLAFVYMEILLTRPKYVMTFGAEVSKVFLGSKFRMTSQEGRWHEVTLDLRSSADEVKDHTNTHTMFVLPCMNPAILMLEQKPEQIYKLRTVTSMFAAEVNQAMFKTQNAVITDDTPDFTPPIVSGYQIKYPVIRSLSELEGVLNEAAEDVNDLKLIGVDAEWQGKHPQNHGSYLRCLQLGWNRGKAAVLHLHKAGGGWDLKDDAGNVGQDVSVKAMTMIRNFFARNSLRVAGFYYQADHEWLGYNGLDLLDYYEGAEQPHDCRTKGGFGVELAVNVYDEFMTNNLEAVRWRFTNVHDYYFPFERYRRDAMERAKAEAGDDEEAKALVDMHNIGFGWISDEDLYPYAGGDADVTVTAALEFSRLLDADVYGIDLWESFWNAQRAAPCCCEIMRTGMPVSLQQCLKLSVVYGNKLEDIRREIEKCFNWKDFPLDTWQQLSDAIFGGRYAGYRDKTTGARFSKRPPGARTLNLEPVMSNEENPVDWKRVRASGDDEIKTPATSLKAIKMLTNSPSVEARRHDGNKWVVEHIPPPKELQLIADGKALRQLQKNFVGSPVWAGSQPSSRYIDFQGGYPKLVCDDGYLRCFMTMTKETGRWAAAMPNLHNSPNKQEAVYRAIMGKDEYPGFIRTMFEAPPGYVIVESDYASAELFMLGMASTDVTLLDHCRRNLLPPTDPNFVDPHANLCVKSFRFNCAPTADGLDSIGQLHMRNIAKCVAADEFVWTDMGPIRAGKLAEDSKVDEIVPLELGVRSFEGYTPLIASLNTGKAQCRQVIMSSGHSITATLEHRHLVTDRNCRSGWKEVQNIEIGDQLWMRFDGGEYDACHGIPQAVYTMMEDLIDPGKLRVNDDRLRSRAVRMLGMLAAIDLSREDDTTVDLKFRHRCLSRMSQVAQELEWLLKLRFSVAVLDASTIRIRGEGIYELLAQIRECFAIVPDLVLCWPRDDRETYACGIMFARMTGVRQGMSMRMAATDALNFQMLVQTLGYLVKVEGSKVTPYCGGSQAWFEAAIADYSELDYDVPPQTLSVRGGLQRIIQWCDQRCHSLKINSVELDLTSTRQAVYESLELLASDAKTDTETAEEAMFLQRLLSSGLVPMTVLQVKDVGVHQTYDFETTSEQDHAITVSGVLTHNSCIYGWAYGRGAAAIVLGARESGVTIDLAEAEKLLAGLESSYFAAANYLEEAASRVKEGFLITPLGRVRRCPRSTDRKKLAGYAREFKNTPIQGGVAAVVNTAAYNLRRIRAELQMRFHIMLQMHDAFFFLVPYHEVVQLCNDVIPRAMCDDIPIYPYRLDGTRPQGGKPYYMGNNINIYFRWKEKMPKEEKRDRLIEVGIDVDKIKRLEF